jgi:hypothetical protein
VFSGLETPRRGVRLYGDDRSVKYQSSLSARAPAVVGDLPAAAPTPAGPRRFLSPAALLDQVDPDIFNKDRTKSELTIDRNMPSGTQCEPGNPNRPVDDLAAARRPKRLGAEEVDCMDWP